MELIVRKAIHYTIAAIGQLEVDGATAGPVMKIQRVVIDFFPHGGVLRV
jgi:hypothetical protein